MDLDVLAERGEELEPQMPRPGADAAPSVHVPTDENGAKDVETSC